jgi:hypothetical protein
MISLEAKLIALGVLVIAILGGFIAWNLHERGIGAAKCEKADTAALQAQLEAITAERDAYDQLLTTANASLKTAQGKLDSLSAQPAPHLVCHSSDPIPVSRVPVQTDGGLAAPGTANAVHTGDFDPGPELTRLSIAYERRVEEARDALNRWPAK